jgi:hypothetical protein
VGCSRISACHGHIVLRSVRLRKGTLHALSPPNSKVIGFIHVHSSRICHQWCSRHQFTDDHISLSTPEHVRLHISIIFQLLHSQIFNKEKSSLSHHRIQLFQLSFFVSCPPVDGRSKPEGSILRGRCFLNVSTHAPVAPS